MSMSSQPAEELLADRRNNALVGWALLTFLGAIVAEGLLIRSCVIIFNTGSHYR